MMIRRLLGGLVIASLMLLAVAPLPVRASFDRSVSFPSYEDETYPLIDGWSYAETNCDAVSYPNAGYPETNGGGGVGGGFGASMYGNSCRFSDNAGTNFVSFGLVVGTSYRVTVTWCGDGTGTQNVSAVWVNGAHAASHSSLGAVGGGGSSNAGQGHCDNPTPGGSGTPGVSTWTGAAPSGATGFRVTSSGTYLGLRSITVSGVVAASGGDCAGSGALAGGSGYVSNSVWGDFYWDAYNVCRSSNSGSTTIDLVGTLGFDAGTRYEIDASWCTDGNSRTFSASWVTTSGVGPSIFSVASSKSCASGFRVISVESDAPADVLSIRLTRSPRIYLESLELVEFGVGDPGDSEIPPLEYDPGCTEPDGGWLDVDWFGYLGCQLFNGFSGLPGFIAQSIWNLVGQPIVTQVASIIDLITNLPDTLADMFIFGPLSGFLSYLGGLFDTLVLVWEWLPSLPGLLVDGLMASPLGVALEALVTLVTAIPEELATAIMGGLGDLLEFLFVPGEATADAYEALLDSADDRVPIGWVSEVWDYLSGMLTGGNLAGSALALSFPIMGATVSYDPAPITAAFAPYRPVGAAIVYITLGMAVWRSIGRGLST